MSIEIAHGMLAPSWRRQVGLLSRGYKTAAPISPRSESRTTRSRGGSVYSLSSPVLAVTSKAVPRHERKLKPLGDFRLDEHGGALVALVRVLVVDRRVMLLWVIAAFLNDGHELAELL